MEPAGPLVIATFSLPTEAEMARELLEQNGIAAVLRDEGLVGVHPWLSNAVGGVKVVVPAEDAERAVEILEGAGRASDSGTADTGDASTPAFPDLEIADEPEPSETNAPVLSEADALAARAAFAAYFGLLLLPPLFHFWSLWLLIQASRSSTPLGERGRKQAWRALAVDLLVFAAAGAVLIRVLTH